jgi:hypothetical protein
MAAESKPLANGFVRRSGPATMSRAVSIKPTLLPAAVRALEMARRCLFRRARQSIDSIPCKQVTKPGCRIRSVAAHFLTPASRDDYLGWLREHRREWTQHARIPPLSGVGACFDWGLYALWRSSQWLLLQTNWPIRGWWRVRAPLGWISVQSRKPRYYRRYTFPWAIEHAIRRYPRPF